MTRPDPHAPRRLDLDRFVDPGLDFTADMLPRGGAAPRDKYGAPPPSAVSAAGQAMALEATWRFDARDACTVVLPTFALEPYSTLGRARMDMLDKASSIISSVRPP